MADSSAPWSSATPAPPRDAGFPWGRLLPLLGPLMLFVIWDLVVRVGWVKVILLPTPSATLYTLVGGLAGGPLLTDFLVTLWRTVQAFLIAAAFGALLIVLFNSAYGVINARKQRIMAAKVMGATRWQIFKDVLIWESLQPTFVGLRSAVSIALVIVIVAEMFIGSDSGLGHRIIDAQQVLNVKSMYAAILSAGALGYALNIVFLVLEKRIVHWSGR